ncbi:hypothetical protein H6P81_016151 [Aristolochia fimbriata]|uniref:HNH homing endonuclease n=1 Tax=Aristolochia fimbriata TaxID=158543 RepID=A0AAV7EAJ9_ARIFI|nr:hypothetical protein H6P81_016151 [Aristolochia fimbriata]
MNQKNTKKHKKLKNCIAMTPTQHEAADEINEVTFNETRREHINMQKNVHWQAIGRIKENKESGYFEVPNPQIAKSERKNGEKIRLTLNWLRLELGRERPLSVPRRRGLRVSKAEAERKIVGMNFPKMVGTWKGMNLHRADAHHLVPKFRTEPSPRVVSRLWTVSLDPLVLSIRVRCILIFASFNFN